MAKKTGSAAPPDLIAYSSTSVEPAAARDIAAHPELELAPELEIVRRLGAGGAGEVFLARDRQLKRLVAVKVLSKELIGDTVARARFEREAAAAAALDHPNTVTVHRFGYTPDGVPYLVMRYVNGVTLAERLAAEGALPVLEARRILAEVAGGLAAAHKRGFVHRDIRPANVLCERESGRVLVTDFGLAGLLPAGDGTTPRLTRLGEVLGDPRYLSPEQLRGEAVTESTDIYALGVMGYEALTGEAPFRADSGADLGAAHLRSAPRSLASLRPDIDPQLADVLQRCLAKDPRQRPDAAHVARTLREPAPAAGGTGRGRNTAEMGGGFLQDLIRRRLPQVVVITVGAGYAGLGFIDQLVDRGVLPPVSYSLSLSTFASCVGASGVISWFHGKKGRQRISRLEVGLLALVLAGWLLTCVLIVAL